MEAVYENLVGSVILDVTTEAFKQCLLKLQKCDHCGTFCSNYNESSGADIYGNKYEVADVSAVLVDCQICGKKVAVNRFAPHLEKCLGVGGRTMSRAKRSGNEPASLMNSPSLSSTATNSVSQSPANPQKRSRPSGGSKQRSKSPSKKKGKKDSLTLS